MDRNEFSRIRHALGKTQRQMAQLLGTSLKAVQSFEQGWRTIPAHSERQALFLFALRHSGSRRKPCWVVRRCPQEMRENCPAWEFRAGHLCWFINGTICEGRAQKNWQAKLQICRECAVYRGLFRGELASPGSRIASGGRTPEAMEAEGCDRG